jgi:hypothetical protein
LHKQALDSKSPVPWASGLQRKHIFLKKILGLLVGEHFFNQPEDGLFVIVVPLLDKPHLLHRGFAFNGTVWGLAVT